MMSNKQQVCVFADRFGMTLSDFAKAVQSVIPGLQTEPNKIIMSEVTTQMKTSVNSDIVSETKRRYSKCNRPPKAAKECDIGQIMTDSDGRYHIVVHQRAGRGMAQRWKLVKDHDIIQREMQRVADDLALAIRTEDVPNIVVETVEKGIDPSNSLVPPIQTHGRGKVVCSDHDTPEDSVVSRTDGWR